MLCIQKYRIRMQKEALLLQANNERNQVIPTDQMYQTQLQPELLLSQPQSLLQPQVLQLELQSQHHPGQYFNSPPNYSPNYNHFHPSGVTPQYALYKQQVVPNNNPISYTHDIPTVSDVEKSTNQLGLNEGLQAPTYPQLHHEQHYGSIEDGNQLPCTNIIC